MVSQLLVSRNCLFSRNEAAAVGGRGVEGGGVKRKKKEKRNVKENCGRALRAEDVFHMLPGNKT